MKRRKFIRLAQTSAFTALATLSLSKFGTSVAQQTPNNPLTVQWLGHTCFRFTGGGLQVLVNPFRQIGCTAGYRNPKVETDLVLISSRLLDEGSVDGFSGNPALLYEPGVYQFNGTQIQGIRTIKDRKQGRRFGINVAWMWKQAGIKILHLGGLAGPIDIEERILIGRPDLMLVPVGGGLKAYTPQEAKQTIQTLKPKIVIPTHYKTLAADLDTCDLFPVDNFLQVMDGIPVRKVDNDTLSLAPGNLPPEGSVIEVLSYPFGGSSLNSAT